MSEWFGEPLRELPHPDDSQRQRLRELATEWRPMTQTENDELQQAIEEFAAKHDIKLEEEQ